MTDTQATPRPGRKLLRRGQRRRERAAVVDEGRMPLIDHLREFRNRLVVCLVAMVPGIILGALFYEEIATFLVDPVCEGTTEDGDAGCGPLTSTGLTGPFTTAIILSVGSGLLIAAPVILYQLWAFVTPGLHRHERRWSLAFLGSAIPLFFLGAALCYLIMPNAVQVLLGFTIGEADNLVDINEYLNLLIRLIIVFGIGFDIPVFLVLLCAVGVIEADTIRRSWRWVVVGTLVFSAVASPTGDPVTLLALALPMTLLIALSYVVARFIERRRARHRPDYSDLDDDETSELDTAPSRLDEHGASRLDDLP